jgi:predicted ribonuclease toxin of YeeF-YezG toxin-antitoxin module
MANLADRHTMMAEMARQGTVYLRELAAEADQRHHLLSDPVGFIFREWYYDHEKLEAKTVIEITKLLDSEVGEFMLARCADPRLSIQYNVVTDRMHAQVHGTIDKTASVEWRLRCADD